MFIFFFSDKEHGRADDDRTEYEDEMEESQSGSKWREYMLAEEFGDPAQEWSGWVRWRGNEGCSL
jgi:hypothetical protein